jgi:hypothetical protein
MKVLHPRFPDQVGAGLAKGEDVAALVQKNYVTPGMLAAVISD